jgi:hypothetical protein
MTWRGGVSRDEGREVLQSKENILSHIIRILESGVSIKSINGWSRNHYWYIMVAIIAQLCYNVVTKEVMFRNMY